MKKSQYIVEQEGKNSDFILMYSTFSTSIVELNKNLYKEVFVDGIYNKHPQEVAALYNMGFLIDDNYDELAYLESLRIKTLQANASAPTYYIICPTTNCNARCYYCFEKDSTKKSMDKKTAEAVANYIINNHDREHLVIQWFGGEPLLEPEIISYITEQLHENEITFASKIITNGYCLSDSIIEKAVGTWNVRSIQITVDALQEEYNKIKNYINSDENPFEKVMTNIGKCLSKGINIRIRINFNPLEYEKAVKTVSYLRERFGDNANCFIYLAPIDSENIPPITEEFREKKKHPLIALLDAEKDFCSFGNYDYRSENGTKYDAILKKYYLTPIPASCYGGCESSLTIDSVGNIFVCHRLLGNEIYSSGNVFIGRIDNDISKYYSNPYINDVDCNKCNLLPLCQGGCKFRAFKYGKKHACTLISGAIKELIKRASIELND